MRNCALYNTRGNTEIKKQKSESHQLHAACSPICRPGHRLFIFLILENFGIYCRETVMANSLKPAGN
jgi:hypothetical protein